MVNKTIRTGDILLDPFFRFSSGAASAYLRRSIRHIGVQTPLTVIDTRHGYRLAAGFKRFDEARALGIEMLPARVLERTVQVPDLFIEVIEEQMTIRPLKLIEKARVLNIFRKSGYGWESIPDVLTGLLDLGPNPRLLDRIVRLLDFSPSVQEYIEEYDLSLNQTEMFRGLSLDEQETVVMFSRPLGLRSVELNGILEWIRDIAVREKCSVRSVLQSETVEAVLHDAMLNRQERVQRLKEQLRMWRYPKLGAWNKKLENCHRQLDLPDNVTVSWDRTLEDPGISIRLHLLSTEQIDLFQNRLWSSENRRILESMHKALRS